MVPFRAAGVVLLAAAGCAPGSEPDLEVLAVSPSRISALEQTPATIAGRGFSNAVEVDVDDTSSPRVHRGWRFTIPETSVLGWPATRVSDSTLSVLFPRGLPLGEHDLTITSPGGHSRELVDAITVSAGGGAGGSGGATAGAAGAAGTAGSAGAGGQPGGAAGSGGTLEAISFDPPTAIGALVDTSAFDDDPTFTTDRLELYFDSSRDTTLANPDDLWVSSRPTTTDPWGPPTRVDELSSGSRDTTPGVAGDGLTIWLSSNRPGGPGGHDLWVATRPDRASLWTAPVPVSELNTTVDELAPQVSGAGLVMVLERDDPGGAGGHDLYLSTRPSLAEPWGAPEPITELNTSANEYAGRLVLGGRALVFCSDRSSSTGRDIYVAERTTLSEPFSPPQPLVDVNTTADEFDPWPSEDLRYLVFASNRDGNTELYEARR